jgi:hypothetical protein
MNRYQTPTPRTVFALAAAALAAATMGLLVLAPATLDAGHADVPAIVAGKPAAPIEVSIVPAHVEVTGVREPELAASPDKAVRPSTLAPG